MKLVAFTYPDCRQGEADMLNRILPWVHALHIRKTPEVGRKQFEQLLDNVDDAWHERIWLHQYGELYQNYNIGGVHLTASGIAGFRQGWREWCLEWAGKGLGVSITCRDLAELNAFSEVADRVFLAPVYDSISKPGHLSAFSIQELKQALSESLPAEVIALGGVQEGNIEALMQVHFDGVAVLGALWNAADPVAMIFKLKQLCQADCPT